MGIDNCDKNVWAVALKEIVCNKSREEMLYISEEERNHIIHKNNELVFKAISNIQNKEKDYGEILFINMNNIANEIVKIHINRVKEILIKALNYQAL
jgi:hypothetical protein